MEKMRQFDKILQEDKDCSYQRVMYRLMTGIYVFVGSIMFFVPYKQLEWQEDWKVMMIPVLFWALAVWYYMAVYIQTGDEKKRTVVYDLLRFAPISKKEIRKNRSKIMLRFVGKLTFAMFLMQVITSILMQNGIGIECILYPAVIGLWLLGNGWLQIVLGTLK
ncbi:MAG: hypothetical protein J6A92_05345 [Lachnospiraceae bacterium]|nr:hypothetical protein [Lachnospiraceae bacterium]